MSLRNEASGQRRPDRRTALRGSVRARFGLSTLVLVLALSVVFVSVESYRSYRRELERLNHQLSQIEQSHLPAIVSSLWLTDYTLLQSQVEAIVRFPYIDRVEVVNDEGAVFHAGASGSGGSTPRERMLTYSRRGTEIPVGSLRLYVDQAGLRAETLRSEVVPAVGHLVLSVAIAAAVTWLFRRQVSIHLERLAVYVENTDVADESPEFELSRRRRHGDELDRLADAVNEMRRRLAADLRERELLVSEVHHRIKNDMGFVKALLSLQAASSDAPETTVALEEASRRVEVMSRIYERLYRGNDVHEVHLRPLVEQIIGDFGSRGLLPADAVALSVEDISVTTRISVATGVILNELVTNAAKYAFDGVTHPRVSVQVRADTDDILELSVSDNGEGFPEDVIRGERAGYGLTIVKALVEQHEGSLELRNDDGAVTTVRLADRSAKVVVP